MARADTLVFDKTGTLTQATPYLVEIVPFGGFTWREVLKLAACLEEHFPHPVAKAIVRRAAEEGVDHNEEHATVNYIAAHGIVSSLNRQRVIIGSRHFVADDEGLDLSAAKTLEERAAREWLSLLYLAHGGQLAGVLAIQDPIREEAAEVIGYLRRLGFEREVMLTGDGPGTAAAVAGRLGITEYAAQILPRQKADYVAELKKEGRIVVMVGDGINDSPGLSLADVGVSMGDGADLARAVADVTLRNHDLYGLVMARVLADKVIKRIRANYRWIVGGNTALLGLALFGLISPGLSAVLHNLLTVGVSLHNLRPCLPPSPKKLAAGPLEASHDRKFYTRTGSDT